MKKIIDGVIVVEGKTDVAFLNEFIDAEFVITNGSDVPQSTIDYLKHVSQTRKIYVLTDPDSPGKRIRDLLDSQINGLRHCFLNKINCIKNGKVGVAESTKDEIINSLNNYFVKQNNITNNLSMSDLFSLGLVGEGDAKNNREKVSKKLNLGYCNAKTFLKRLNNNGITINEIKNLL